MLTQTPSIDCNGTTGKLIKTKANSSENFNQFKYTPKLFRKNQLKKRFNSLTDGFSNFFNSEKRANEDSLSRNSSKESIQSSKSLQTKARSRSKDSFRDDLENFVENDDGRRKSRPRARSFTSFKSSKAAKLTSPPIPLQKRSEPSIPPSPPERRYSFWFTPKTKKKNLEIKNQSKALTSNMSTQTQTFLEPLTSPGIVNRIYNTRNKIDKLKNNHSESIYENFNNATDSKNISKSVTSSCCSSVYEKTASIILQKENGTFGFTLRGGLSPNNVLRPLLVTYIRPNSPSHREGSLKAGDRIIAVDGKDLTMLSLIEAQRIIQQVDSVGTFTIRFDVSVMDSIRQRGEPLLVEIERNLSESLGLSLNIFKVLKSSYIPTNENQTTFCPVVVESISTASIAERCGVLAVGDIVCSMDGEILSESNIKNANINFSSGDTKKVTLEIIPIQRRNVQKRESVIQESPNTATRRVYQSLRRPHRNNIHQKNRISVRLPPSGAKSSKPISEVIDDQQESVVPYIDYDLSVSTSQPLVQNPRLRPNVSEKILQNGIGPTNWYSDNYATGSPANQGNTRYIPVIYQDELWGNSSVNALHSTSLKYSNTNTPIMRRLENEKQPLNRNLFPSSPLKYRQNERLLDWRQMSTPKNSHKIQRKFDNNDETDWEKMIADLNEISTCCELREKSVVKSGNQKIQDSSRTEPNSWQYSKGNCSSRPGLYSNVRHDEGIYAPFRQFPANNEVQSPTDSNSPIRLISATLYKDQFYEDFGFSLSDGLYQKGVFVNRIRKGGPAHRSCLIMPYDRILQVNETNTEDFDCCLTVPLIAAAEETLFLKVSRSQNPWQNSPFARHINSETAA